ncbi:MAG: hypothetical protein QOE36_1661 [Gaiellaceae bacterium]|nr:hypothetical protein [Gaiellaceae bacterium]
MDSNDLRLDGNALGGLLGEVFSHELTSATCQCGGCGAEEPLGATPVYVHAPGVVVRCPHCDAAVLVVVRSPRGWRVALEGLARIEIDAPLA